jgi:hypothetical protein
LRTVSFQSRPLYNTPKCSSRSLIRRMPPDRVVRVSDPPPPSAQGLKFSSLS